jgi:hypothetical protein
LGFNQIQTRRKMGAGVSFDVLSQLAEYYPVARACINYRRAQITQLKWDIVTREKDGSDVGMDMAREFFAHPSTPDIRFRELLDVIIEDLLTYDAVAIEKEITVGGKLLRLLPVDASTIQLLVNEAGRTPEPPDPAFRQIIRGRETCRLTTDEMMYEMMNPRTKTPYGLAPLESLIVQANSALRSSFYNMSYLNDGNIPEGFIAFPKEMIGSMQQLKELQVYWDTLMANPRNFSRLKVVPEGFAYTPAKKHEDMSYREFEEWLLMLTCSVFGVQPEQIGFTKQVNKATSETTNASQEDTGLRPLANFLKEIFDDVLEWLGYPNLEWSWVDLQEKDELEKVQIYEAQLRNGIKSLDEIREEEGLEPYGCGPFIMTATGPILIKDVINPPEITLIPEPPQAPVTDNTPPNTGETNPKEGDDVIAELEKWQRFSLSRMRKGQKMRVFESDIIPQDVQDDISFMLSSAKTTNDIRKAFEYHLSQKVDFLKKASDLGNAIESYIDAARSGQPVTA